MLGVWAPDVHEVPPASAVRQFGFAALIAAAFAGIVYMSVPDRPAALRSYPRGGLAKELGSELVAVSASICASSRLAAADTRDRLVTRLRPRATRRRVTMTSEGPGHAQQPITSLLRQTFVAMCGRRYVTC